MERLLPAGLSEAQRSALLAFFAGHISGGQLTQRLGIEPPPRTCDSKSERESHPQELRAALPRHQAGGSASRLRRRLAT